AASRRSSMGCARRSRRNSRDGGGGRRRSRPRTPPAPPQAAWAPSTWVAAPFVLGHDNARAAVGFATHSVRFLAHALGAFPSPLWFSGWSFPEMEVDSRAFITR